MVFGLLSGDASDERAGMPARTSVQALGRLDDSSMTSGTGRIVCDWDFQNDC